MVVTILPLGEYSNVGVRVGKPVLVFCLYICHFDIRPTKKGLGAGGLLVTVARQPLR